MKLKNIVEQNNINTTKYRRTKTNLVLANAVYNAILMGGGKLKLPLKNNDISIIDIFDAIKSQNCIKVANYKPDKQNKHLDAISLGPSYLEQQISRAIDRAVEEGAIPHSYVSYLRSEIGLDKEQTTRKDITQREILKRQSALGQKLHESKEIQDLPDAKITIELPQSRQSEHFSCGATVIQMIAAYYGKNIRESDLIDQLEIKNSGIKLSRIGEVAQNIGLKSHKDKLSYQEILKTLEDEIPIVVAIQKPNADQYHFMIAVGYYDNGIIFRDPARFTYGYLPQQEFEKRCYKSNDKFLILAIASDKKQYFSPQKVEKS